MLFYKYLIYDNIMSVVYLALLKITLVYAYIYTYLLLCAYQNLLQYVYMLIYTEVVHPGGLYMMLIGYTICIKLGVLVCACTVLLV